MCFVCPLSGVRNHSQSRRYAIQSNFVWSNWNKPNCWQRQQWLHIWHMQCNLFVLIHIWSKIYGSGFVLAARKSSCSLTEIEKRLFEYYLNGANAISYTKMHPKSASTNAQRSALSVCEPIRINCRYEWKLLSDTDRAVELIYLFYCIRRANSETGWERARAAARAILMRNSNLFVDAIPYFH